MKKTNLILLILIILAIIGVGIYLFFTSQKVPIIVNGGDLKIDTTTQDEQSNLTEEETLYNKEDNIKVFQPKTNASIGSPIKILGEARVFENQFAIRIKDSKGNILAEESVMAMDGDMGQFNLFEKKIEFSTPKTSTGTIEAFQYSAKDGSEIDKVTIPVKFNFKNNNK